MCLKQPNWFPLSVTDEYLPGIGGKGRVLPDPGACLLIRPAALHHGLRQATWSTAVGAQLLLGFQRQRAGLVCKVAVRGQERSPRTQRMASSPATG